MVYKLYVNAHYGYLMYYLCVEDEICYLTHSNF